MKKKYKLISVLLSVVLMISLTSSTAFAKKIKPAAPAIDLEVTGVFTDVDVDGFASIGDTITYSYTVINTGNVTLSNIVVTGNITLTVPIATTLAVGARSSASATCTLTAADLEDKSFVYNATVNGTDPVSGQTVSDSDTFVTELVLPVTAAIGLDITGVFNDTVVNGYADAGDTVTFTYTVKNLGAVALTSVLLTDGNIVLDAGVAVADLAPGGVDASTTAVYTLTAGDILTKSITYEATVTALFDDGISTNEPADSSVTESDVFSYQLSSEPIGGDAVQLLDAPYNNLSTPVVITDDVELFYTKQWIDSDADGIFDGSERFLFRDTLGALLPLPVTQSFNETHPDEYLGQVDPPDDTPEYYTEYIIYGNETDEYYTADLINNVTRESIPDGLVDTTVPVLMTDWLHDNGLWYPHASEFTPEALAIVPQIAMPETLLDNLYWDTANVQTYKNAWQADWKRSDTLVNIDFVDWGNPLETTDPLVGYRFPVELYLYTKLPSDQLMTAYKMACLDYPSSADEVYGTNMTTFESYYATVLTNKFRVEVFDGEQFYEIGIEPAIGPSGKMNFASAGGGWIPQKPGTHRIYFYLNDPLISLSNAIINNDDHYVFSYGLMAEGLSSKKEGVAYINGQWATWIDVDVKLPNSNGGRKK